MSRRPGTAPRAYPGAMPLAAWPRTTERHYILSQPQLALEQMQRAMERRRRQSGRDSEGEEDELE